MVTAQRPRTKQCFKPIFWAFERCIVAREIVAKRVGHASHARAAIQSLAQVRLLHAPIIQQLTAQARERDGASLHDIAAVRKTQRGARILFHQ